MWLLRSSISNLLRNQVLVGATLAILIVAGTINALMYVLSLYFQDPAGFGMSALETGVATLPAAAAMIVITPFITPLAVRIGTRLAIVAGFGCAALGFGVLAFVQSSWTYAAFVVPLVVLSAGLGLANGPASSASTAAVSGRSGRAGLRDLEHGSLHRRVVGGGRGRDGLQLGHGRPRRRGCITLERTGGRVVAGLAPARGLLGAGDRDRIPDGPPPSAERQADQPGCGRRGLVTHDPDPARDHMTIFAYQPPVRSKEE